MSNHPAKYEVLIKQYLRSILDVSAMIWRANGKQKFLMVSSFWLAIKKYSLLKETRDHWRWWIFSKWFSTFSAQLFWLRMLDYLSRCSEYFLFYFQYFLAGQAKIALPLLYWHNFLQSMGNGRQSWRSNKTSILPHLPQWQDFKLW